MVPSGEPTRATVKELGELLSPGDVIVDGGNSKFTDDQMHDVMLREKGIGYIDAGVSGGVWGLENGYALMVGGTKDDVALAEQPAELAHRRPGGLARGHHHPDDPRRRERLDQPLEAVDVALARRAVVPDDLVTGAAQPLGHVAAHLARPDQPQAARSCSPW